MVQRACQELTSDRSVSVAAIRAGRFFKRVIFLEILYVYGSVCHTSFISYGTLSSPARDTVAGFSCRS